MDKREAQLILSAVRPGAPEAAEPSVAAALAVAEADPALKAWWEAQQAFDRKVAAKLAEAPVPAYLRDRLVAAPKIMAIPPQWRHRGLLAAAALVALLCVAGVFWQVENSSRMNRADFADDVVSQLGNGGPYLAIQSTDHQKVMDWLKAQNAPLGEMPSKLNGVPSIGCQRYTMHGHVVGLVCFTLANGKEAHLFMIDKSALTDPPDTHGPQFDKVEGWNVASWSDNKMTYLLATNASMGDLKQLL